jgi:hypothetical protein
MRRRNTLSLALILVLVAMLGMASGVLAKQSAEPIVDTTSKFDKVTVNCGELPCDQIEAVQKTYYVTFQPTAYIPENTYEEAMVVLVTKGTLAFRVQSPDVFIDPQGNEIQLLEPRDPVTHAILPVDLGQPPKDMVPQPVFEPVGPIDPAGCSSPTVQNLCLLDPGLFQDGTRFAQLVAGDIVYLPAKSTCFFCNTTETGDQQAEVLVWAPGTGFDWYEQSLIDNALGGTGTPTTQGSGRIVGWMLNPGAPCH